MKATLDEHAELVAQRNRLDVEAQALRRQLDNEEVAATYEEAAARKDQEQRLDFLDRTRHDLQTRIEALDRDARRTQAEREQVRAYATGQLTAARARLARVAYEEANLEPVITSLTRRKERVLTEIATFEAQLRALEPPPPAPREAPADAVSPTEPPLRLPATALARRARAALVWSANPDDDPGDET